MARRNANLAGLAALGALGYALTRGKDLPPVEDREGVDVVRSAAPEPIDYGPDYERELARAGRGPVGIGAVSASAPSRVKTPYSMSSDTIDSNIKQRAKEKVTDTGDETARLARRYPGSAVDRIPGSSPEGWTGGTGERINSTETGRNLSNIMNSTAGLSVPGYVGKMTQAGYNARAAARRAAGDLTPAEVEAVRQRISDSAIAGGMKKGGKVKVKKLVVTKSGGKVSSASKRADGIASKGKTRGKFY